MLSQRSLPPLAKVSGLKDHGAASANTWLSCASRELSCWALESVTYLCGGSGLGFISETLWHLGLNSSLLTPHVAGADRDTCAQCSHSLSTPWPPPGTTRDGSGGLQSSSSLIPWRMLQPGAWRMLQPHPGLALAVASRAKALQGLPLSLSPAQLCSALLCSVLLQTSPGSLRTALLLLSLQTPSLLLACCLT